MFTNHFSGNDFIFYARQVATSTVCFRQTDTARCHVNPSGNGRKRRRHPFTANILRDRICLHNRCKLAKLDRVRPKGTHTNHICEVHASLNSPNMFGTNCSVTVKGHDSLVPDVWYQTRKSCFAFRDMYQVNYDMKLCPIRLYWRTVNGLFPCNAEGVVIHPNMSILTGCVHHPIGCVECPHWL